MLNSQQIAFFKSQGYLLLPGMLDETLCSRAQDELWASLPQGSDICRDKPATHVGPFTERDTQIDPMDSRVGYRWQVRKNGTSELLINLMYSEKMLTIAAQLLGEDRLQQPVVNGTVMGSNGYAWPGGPVDPADHSQGVRGTYATLPYKAGETNPHGDSGAHTDGHPFMLSMVGLIDDCPPGGGAFTLWPGSHRRLYPTFWMQYDQARIPYYDHMPSFKGLIHPPEYHSAVEQILQDTQPVDCWGRKGDVVIWHHRMLHCASENRSQVIRQAVLADISRKDLDKLRLDPPRENMWRDWSADIWASDGLYSSEFAQIQRCQP